MFWNRLGTKARTWIGFQGKKINNRMQRTGLLGEVIRVGHFSEDWEDWILQGVNILNDELPSSLSQPHRKSRFEIPHFRSKFIYQVPRSSLLKLFYFFYPLLWCLDLLKVKTSLVIYLDNYKIIIGIKSLLTLTENFLYFSLNVSVKVAQNIFQHLYLDESL